MKKERTSDHGNRSRELDLALKSYRQA